MDLFVQEDTIAEPAVFRPPSLAKHLLSFHTSTDKPQVGNGTVSIRILELNWNQTCR